MNKNKSATVVWFDDYNPESYVLCCEAYGIKILNAEVIDEFNTEITVYGPIENINKFLEDYDEGNVEPFETVGSGDYDDEDYEAWLNNEVNRMFDLAKQEYDPEYDPSYEDLDAQYREDPGMTNN